jgi:hypothetical protein
MTNAEGRVLLRSMIIVCVGAVFALVILWLVEPPISYVLAVFEILTMLGIYLVIDGCCFEINLSRPSPRSQTVVNLLLVTLPLLLISSTILGICPEPVRALLALLSTSFIPGYAVLRLSRLYEHFSKLETFLFSYLLSYVYTGFAWFALSSVALSLRPTVLLVSIMILGILCLVVKNPPERQRPPSFCQAADVVAIAGALGFFAVSFLFIYPGFALLPGTDISRHYGWSLALGRYPALYNGFNYLLAHLHESAFLYASDVSVALAQMALVMLNLMIPLAFYVAAKALLSHIDPRIPALATLFWVLFSNSFGGFAWIYFALLKLGDVGQTQAQLLNLAADHTYNGTIYGILGLWYGPATIALVILLSLMSLIGNHSIPRTAFVAIFSTLFAGLFLTHAPEAVFLSLFLVAFSFLRKNENLRIGESLVSIALGYVIVLAVYCFSEIVFVRFAWGTWVLVSVALPLAAVVSVLALRPLNLTLGDLFQGRIGSDAAKKAATVLLSVIAFVYVTACFSSSLLIGGFHTGQVNSIGLVPWFMYPIMLGVNGLLGLLAMLWIVRDQRYLRACLFLAVFLASAFLLGKLVSFANLALFSVGYWEKRFILIDKIALAMLAPIPVLVVVSRLRTKLTGYHTRAFVAASLIGIVVLAGFPTTALNVNYWANVSRTPEYMPSLAEADAIASLRRLIDGDPASWLATVTDTSSNYAVFAGPPDTLAFKPVLYQSQWPDMALLQLYRHPAFSHPYIYIANRDLMVLNGQPGSVLSRYIKALPVAYRNSEVTIYESPKPSFPQPQSSLALVMPFDDFLTLQQQCSAYYALSGSCIDYTVAYDLDNMILNQQTLVLGFDPPGSAINLQELPPAFEENLDEWEVVSGSWSVDDGSLIAGSSTTANEGIILSPLNLNSFNVTFTVSPERLNPSVSNYVAVAYSYVDGRHFDLVEIHFHPNGLIYALTRTVDGTSWEQSPTYPAWPGNSSGINWQLNSTYRVEVLREPYNIQLFINGTRVLVSSAKNTPGRVGLGYKRADLVRIDDFALRGQRYLMTREVEDYIRYLDEGGTVIVLNTNGYYSFADEMFRLENNTISSSLIVGSSRQIALPGRIPVQVMTPNGSSSEVIASYSSDGGLTSIYLARKQIGLGTLFYVNLYPILQAFKQRILSSPSLPTLSRLLDMFELPRMSEHVISSDGYTRAISFAEGSVTAGSALFPAGMLIDSLEVVSGNDRYVFHNVTLLLLDSPYVVLDVHESYVEGGRGLYSKLTIDAPFLVEFPGSSAIVRINSSTGSAVLDSVSSVTISAKDRLNLLVRNPRIEASTATFHGLISSGYLNSRTGACGQDLRIDGKVVFSIGMSDTYSLLENVEFAGLWTLSPPLMDYDPLSTVPAAILWGLVFLSVTCMITITILAKRLIQQVRRKHLGTVMATLQP